jgi:hypothetical protein
VCPDLDPVQFAHGLDTNGAGNGWCPFWCLFSGAKSGMDGGGVRRIVASASVIGGANAAFIRCLPTRTRRSRTIAGKFRSLNLKRPRLDQTKRRRFGYAMN